MNNETKLFASIIVATVVILGGAIFYFSRPAVPQKGADATLLTREDSNKTSTTLASVTLVEFGDFQCPACGAYHPLVKQLLSEFHTDVTFVFRNFPLPMHANSTVAAQAAESAGKQGKYWEMYDMLYEKQKDWSTSGKPKEVFTEYATSIGMDPEKFAKNLDDPDIKKKIDRDTKDGELLGVNATPTFYLNGDKLDNPSSIEDFRTLVKAALLKAPKPSVKSTEAYHTHFNLKIYVNGTAYDLTLPKYQSTDEKELNKDIHVHDGNGDVVHIHKKDVTLGEFISSLGMSLTATCFTDDAKNQYCSSETNTVKFFVNGKANTQFGSYAPQDLDRILISYGKENDAAIKKQIDSVADNACIYSEKCPERGKPPTENCVGGLGTGCKEE